MIKNILFSLMSFFVVQSVYAQTSIKFDVQNYTNDTLIFGYYYAEKILVEDTLLRTPEGRFTFQKDTALNPGMYLLVTVPDRNFYQVLIPEDDQEFEFSVDVNTENSIQVNGSEENEVFYDYMRFVNQGRLELAKLDQALMTTDSVMVTIRQQLIEDKITVNNLVSQRQREIITQYPDHLVSFLIKSNLPFEFPEFQGTAEEIENQKYVYYKKRYFDNTNLLHSGALRTPILDQRVKYYIDNLTPKVPDSVRVSIDYILEKLEPNQEAFRYYLSKFLNEYANSKFIGMDAVYVHLALDYYGMGKAPWVPDENLEEILDNARKTEPILIGKTAPDFNVFDQSGNSYTLKDLNAAYTILVFWRPECGHCSEAMPHVVDFQEKWKERDVQLLTVCTFTGNKYSQCWDDVKNKGMDSLLNTGDEFHRSRIFSKYFINSTPQIYILDKDKKIKLKKVPAENLNAIMEELIKIDTAE